LIDQEEIHINCFSNNPIECIEGLRQLENNFLLLLDKQLAWNNLIKLTSSEEQDIRRNVLKVLTNVLQDVPDKEEVWNELNVLLTSSKYPDIQYEASRMCSSVFQYQKDKQKAWEDLRKLIFDKDDYIRWRSINILGYVFRMYQTEQMHGTF